MECVDARNRAIENAREPLRKEVYNLIEKKISEHNNVLKGKLSVKYYFPSYFTWEVKTIESRKTIDGEEKIVHETIVDCPEIDWLVSELKEKKYIVELKQESGYIYGKSGYLEISTE